jgi:hypothetical protein
MIIHTIKDYLGEPTIDEPGSLAGSMRKSIGRRHPLFQDSLAGFQMPPDIRVYYWPTDSLIKDHSQHTDYQKSLGV